jgi:hypothetical protein
LVSGITHQKPVPPETIPVLLDTARDLAGTEESLELSFALSKVRDWRILGAALVLLEHPRQSPLHWVGRMLAGDYREEEV